MSFHNRALKIIFGDIVDDLEFPSVVEITVNRREMVRLADHVTKYVIQPDIFWSCGAMPA